MGFTAKHEYSSDTATVFKVFTDKAYLEKKFAALGAKNINILECEEKDGEFFIKSQRDVPTNPPGFAKKFLKSFNTVVEIDIWELNDGDIKKGTFEVDIKGTPISIKGEMILGGTDEGCVNSIKGEAKVSIPLVGGQIAKFIEGDTEKNLKEDHAFTKSYVSELET